MVEVVQPQEQRCFVTGRGVEVTPGNFRQPFPIACRGSLGEHLASSGSVLQFIQLAASTGHGRKDPLRFGLQTSRPGGIGFTIRQKVVF